MPIWFARLAVIPGAVPAISEPGEQAQPHHDRFALSARSICPRRSSLVYLPKVAARADQYIMSSIRNGGVGMHHANRHVAPMADISRDSGASLDFAILYVIFHKPVPLRTSLKGCAEVYGLDRPILLLDSCEQLPKRCFVLFATLRPDACRS